MNFQTAKYNGLVNPFYPFISINPKILGPIVGLMDNSNEEILLIAHISFSDSKPAILLVTNQRVKIYKFWDSFIKKTAKFGLNKIKDQVIDSIPIVSDLMAVKEKISDINSGVKKRNVDMLELGKQELNRLTEMIDHPDDYLLENKGKWHEYSAFDLANAAKSLESIELYEDKIHLEWDASEAKLIPEHLNGSTLNIYTDMAMGGLWTIAVKLKPLFHKFGFEVIQTVRGLIINKSPDFETHEADNDLSWLIKSDMLCCFEEEFGYKPIVKKPWEMVKQSNNTSQPVYVSNKDAFLNFIEKELPPTLVFRMIEKNWLGKKKVIDTIFRGRYFEVSPQISEETLIQIKNNLTGFLAEGEEILAAHNRNFHPPFEVGFAFTTEQFIYWKKELTANCIKYKALSKDRIKELFDGIISEVPFFSLLKALDSSEQNHGVVVNNQIIPGYFPEKVKEILNNLCMLNQHRDIETDFSDLTEVNFKVVKSLNYLESKPWCNGVKGVYMANASNEAISVYLVEIESSNTTVNKWLWLIEGMLPTSCLNAQNIMNSYEALTIYIGELEKWMIAVSENKAVDQLLPVDAEASPQICDQYMESFQFVKKWIYPLWIKH